MTKIKPLPSEVIQIIAAGEVIDSLAAVVRELAENAIDAGATRINIGLQPEQWKIRVVDNGQGMDKADLLCCATPHSTSKIGDRLDLSAIQTLGFRGEALYSIAQLASLRVASCVAGNQGYQVKVDRSSVSAANYRPMSVGTRVEASGLFAKFPVRRQALPPLPLQLKAVQEIISHLALCHPQVTWQVDQQHRPWLRISEGKTALDILPQLIKSICTQDLLFRQEVLSTLVPEQANFVRNSRLQMVMGLPDRCHRHQPDWVKVAINGRVVKFSPLEQAIAGAFFRTLPRERHPVCFIHLQLPPHLIDWNRHPAKSELYLQRQDLWQDIIKQAIAKAIDFSEIRLPQRENQRVLKLLQVAEQARPYQVAPQQQPAIAEAADLEAPHQDLPLMVIGQARNTYILVEHPHGIWLVEQHIADERAIYESLKREWQLISLERPLLLDNLSPAQRHQLQEQVGLELEPFGEKVWRVNTIPKALQNHPELEAALLELSLGGDLEAAQVAIACRTAVRNGTPLDFAEMKRIIRRWQACQAPRTCPHGRPICLSLEETSLYRFFRRHWVLGKSHGLTER